jgi:hypothetical protein
MDRGSALRDQRAGFVVVARFSGLAFAAIAAFQHTGSAVAIRWRSSTELPENPVHVPCSNRYPGLLQMRDGDFWPASDAAIRADFRPAAMGVSFRASHSKPPSDL